MIYRVHRPHTNEGLLGSPIAYIQLCHGFITVQHVYGALLEAKLIPLNWIDVDDISVALAPTETYGVNAVNLFKRASRSSLFYLYPIEKIEIKYKNDRYWQYYSDCVPTTPSSFTINRAAQRYYMYEPQMQITQQPVAPIQNPDNLAAQLQLQNNIAQQQPAAPIQNMTRNVIDRAARVLGLRPGRGR